MATQHSTLENLFVRFSLLLLKLVCRLPKGFGYSVGAIIGYLTARFSKNRNRTSLTNLKLCFPDLPVPERLKLNSDTFANNGIGLIETGWSWWADPKPFWDQLKVEGEEHLEHALKNGRGVVLIGGHFSALDLGGLLFAKLVDRFAATYRPHNFEILENELLKGRGRFMDLIDRNDIRGMFKALDANQVVWFAPDQDLGRDRSVFAPFFGVPAATNPGLRKLVKRGATPLFISFFRTKHMRYRLKLEPWPADPMKQDDVQFTSTMNTLLENAIKTEPAQYMWLHKRFKTRPKGETSFYD